VQQNVLIRTGLEPVCEDRDSFEEEIESSSSEKNHMVQVDIKDYERLILGVDSSIPAITNP